MKTLTLITSNLGKVKDYQYVLNMPLEHHNIELDEIQSLDLDEILEHKVRQAYQKLNVPVIVDDASVVFNALGKLPGPFIKFFLKELGSEGICQLISNYSDKTAYYTIGTAYFDGKEVKIFKSQLNGKIAKTPKGEGGYGWDQIFIIDGLTKTRAELTEAEYYSVNARKEAIEKLAEYLKTNE